MGFESPPSGGLVLNFREALQTSTQTTTESSKSANMGWQATVRLFFNVVAPQEFHRIPP